jgi:hypothetical protein
MDASEFLEALQVVDLTRNQPELKPVHDFMLKKCVDHAKEIAEQMARTKDEETKKAVAPADKEDKPASTRYSRS